MKLAVALLVLLLAFYHDVAVNGFSFLSSPLLSPSSYRNRDVLVVGVRQSSMAAVTPKMKSGAAETFLMSFWEGIGQGAGGARATNAATGKQKCPVLICPAQLSVPGDYRQMIADLQERCVFRSWLVRPFSCNMMRCYLIKQQQ